MCRLVRLSPVLPMVSPNRLVQTIHIDEVCQGLLTLVRDHRLTNTIYCLAAAEPLAFAAFLKILAKVKCGRGLYLVPIPLKAALFANDILSRIPFMPSVGRERILGLARGIIHPSAQDLEDIDVILKQCSAALENERP